MEFTMATSSLLGIDRPPTVPSGRDTSALGPSDSSDTGSDVAGLDDLEQIDAGMPIDVALNPNRELPDDSADIFSPGSASDAAGTGERRSAAGDTGTREAADITPDHIVTHPDDYDLLDDPDALSEVQASADTNELAELPEEMELDDEGEDATDSDIDVNSAALSAEEMDEVEEDLESPNS
jgi:hypothetical protein